MSYQSQYTGAQIDEAVGKALNGGGEVWATEIACLGTSSYQKFSVTVFTSFNAVDIAENVAKTKDLSMLYDIFGSIISTCAQSGVGFKYTDANETPTNIYPAVRISAMTATSVTFRYYSKDPNTSYTATATSGQVIALKSYKVM